MNKWIKLLAVSSVALPVSAGVILDLDFSNPVDYAAGNNFADGNAFGGAGTTDGWTSVSDSGNEGLWGTGAGSIKTEVGNGWGGIANSNVRPADDVGLTTTLTVDFKVTTPSLAIGSNMSSGSPFLNFALNTDGGRAGLGNNADANVIGFGIGFHTWDDGLRIFPSSISDNGHYSGDDYSKWGWNPEGRDTGAITYSNDAGARDTVARDYETENLRVVWQSVQTAPDEFSSSIFLINLDTGYTLTAGTNFTGKTGLTDQDAFLSTWTSGSGGLAAYSIEITSLNLTTAAPEPSSLALVAVGAVLLARRKRKLC